MSRRWLVAFAACIAALAGAGPGSASTAEHAAPAPGGGYDPVIDPGDFVGTIDNQYFPLKPGTVFFYEGMNDGRVQRGRLAVTRRTKTILGVTCVVVVDTVTIGGEPHERTFDWYAQDDQGNVWYFGEDSRDHVNGRWVVSAGSWEAGVDGARPGIIMEGQPRRGDVYRQEYYRGHAEDMAKVLGEVEFVSVPYGTFERVLVTREWTPLEPGIAEKKYYAPRIGLVEARAVRGASEHMKLMAVVHR